MPLECPDENELLALIARRLPEPEAERLRSHLDACETCCEAAVDGAQALEARSREFSAASESLEPDPPALALGTRIGRYRVERLIGFGGMGLVYLGTDASLDRKVALKVLRSSRVADVYALEQRLVRESRAMAKLVHPNVLSVFDVGIDDGRLFIAMEFVDGPTLRQWVRDTKPTWREIVARFQQAGEGLAAAHAAGLIHRDFKPDNVLLDSRGRVLVTDFGLVRSVDQPEDARAAADPLSGVGAAANGFGGALVEATRTGDAVGTPAYMSPEQFRGAGVDARADVFSFCVAMWEALHGERPFRGHTAEALHSAILAGPPEVPKNARGVPSWLFRALARGLESDPARRYGSMSELLAALRPRRWVSTSSVAWVSACVVTVFAIVAVGGRAPDPCPGVPATMDGVWGATEKASFSERVLAAAGVEASAEIVRRVSDVLDAQARSWAQARDGMCSAAKVAGAVVPASRLECLEQRRSELLAVTELVRRTEPGALVGMMAKLQFIPAAACAQRSERASKRPAPEDPALAASVAELRGELQNAHALLRVARGRDALTLVDPLVSRARELGYPPIEAEARYLHGRILYEVGEGVAARKVLLEAANVAEAAHHDTTAAWCWLSLVAVATTSLRDEAISAEYIGRARAAIARVGGWLELEARLTYHEGLMHWNARRLDAAEATFLKSIQMLEQVAPEEVPLTYEGLALVYAARDEFGRAKEIHLKVLDARIRLRGAHHPQVALDHTNLAAVEKELGNLEAALAHVQAAVKIVEAAYGTDHLEYALHLKNMAELLRSFGRHGEALTYIDRAIAVVTARTRGPHALLGECVETKGGVLLGMKRYAEAADRLREAVALHTLIHGDQHPTTGRGRINLGEALRRAGHAADALEHQQQAVAIFTVGLGPTHVYTLYARTELGKTLLALGRRADARASLEQAVAGFANLEVDPALAAGAMFQLARAIDRPGAPRREALELARGAIARWEKAPAADVADLVEARAWIAQRTRGAPP